MKPSDFTIGDIYKMNVASRSHVLKPYYVIIKNVTDYYIETLVPGEHSLKIHINTFEWGYHIPRMERIIGYKNGKILR